jgi:hypothetical protein
LLAADLLFPDLLVKLQEALGDYMKKLLFLLVSLALLASGANAQYREADTVNLWIDEIRARNPVAYAILKDHMPEARKIDRMFQAGNADAAQREMVAVVWKYRDRAFSRAGDAAAIEVVRKTNEIIDFLSKNYPQGCLELLRQQLSLKTLSILEETQIYPRYLEAQRLAYEDGKNHAPIARMDIPTMYDVVTNDLGVSDAEIHMIVKPESIPVVQLCSLARKNLNIDAIRESQRGQYARANISSKRAQ